ncbi:MAG: hypothetical protein RMJ54_06005 [Roseiflexaceae bacterium]|nr:hypothetical protein [Roseiflexaceae bacterium]
MPPALWVLPPILIVITSIVIWLHVRTYAGAATAQRWKDRLWPIVFMEISVSLVFYATLAGFEEDIAERQASATASASIAGHHLFVRYPHTLGFNTPETDPLTLTIWLERNAGAIPLTFTVELSSSALLFVDAAGMPIAPQLTLSGDGGSSPQLMRIQPLASNRSERLIVDVIVRDTAGQVLLKEPLRFTIARETQTAFYWRVFRSRFFGDAGLALAVASAVLGIGWQLLNEGRQTRVEQQRERIRELHDLFDRDLMEWALASRALEQEAKKGWEEQVRYELRGTLDKQEQQLTNRATQERVKRLLHDAAEYYRNGDIQRCNTVLDLVIRAYASNYAELRSLPRQLPDARTADRQQAETVLNVCGGLLRCFPTEAYELAAAALDVMASQTDRHTAKERLLEFIRSPGRESGAAELSTLATNDPRIRGRLTDHFPWAIEWPPILPAPGTVARTGAIIPWLEANGLKMHPFDTCELLSCQEFLKGIELQRSQRETIIQMQPLVTVEQQFDRRVAAVALYNALRQPAARLMPVMVELSDQNTTDRTRVVQSVVQAAGTTWLRLIASQPEVLLWLPDDEQALLVEWLVWISGSPQALRQRLRRAGMQRGFQEQIVLRRLDDLLTGIDKSALHPGMFLNWLAIRPPGVEHMRLIVIDGTGDKCAGPIVNVLSEVREVGVRWTIFTSPTQEQTFTPAQVIALRWSEQELLGLLNVAVAVASAGGPAQNLIDLVEMEDPALNEEEFLRDTLKHAHGSFERALAICQRALAHHLDSVSDPNDPGYPFLNENDFKAALTGA